MASLKRVEKKNGQVVYRITISLGYDTQGRKLTKPFTYSVNQSATPKQQEKEALKYALDMEDKIKHGHDYDSEKMSFEEFAYKWLENVKDNITHGTYLGYEQKLRNKIVPYFKGYKLAHIRTHNIESFLKSLVGDYKSSTIKCYVNVLNCMFKTAKRWNVIDNNPCREAERPKKKNEESKIRHFTPQQSIMFIKSLGLSYGVEWRGYDRTIDTDKSAYVKEHLKEMKVPTQYKLFFSICLFCGIRKGEALALKWEDIDFEKLEISITKSVGMTATGIDYKEPKTPNAIRRVPFPEDLLPLLREYKKEYAMLRLELGTAWKGDGNIFAQKDGKIVGNTVAYQYFIAHLNRYNKWVVEHSEQAKALGLLELPIIPLHGLRHSCATLLNYLEVNIVDISKYLGHGNCSTTMNIYAHSFEEQQRAVSNKLNEFLRINAL